MPREASRGGSFGFRCLHIAKVAVEQARAKVWKGMHVLSGADLAVPGEVRLFPGLVTLRLKAAFHHCLL